MIVRREIICHANAMKIYTKNILKFTRRGFMNNYFQQLGFPLSINYVSILTFECRSFTLSYIVGITDKVIIRLNGFFCVCTYYCLNDFMGLNHNNFFISIRIIFIFIYCIKFIFYSFIYLLYFFWIQ